MLNEYVRPSGNIPKQIRELTGITNKMVAGADTIEQVLPRVAVFVGDAPIVAHNAHFDRRFVEHNARLLGMTFTVNEWVCTMRMAQRVPLAVRIGWQPWPRRSRYRSTAATVRSTTVAPRSRYIEY